MDYVFDGCTEILLNQIIESSPNGCPEAEILIQQLSEFQNVCLNMGLCPKGELIRSFMCRHFLRDAMQRMAKVLSSVNEDEAIGSIMERTRQFIDSVGEETEAERAYVVVRNLIIIAENIVKQTKKQLLPTVSKQPVRMICYHIDLEGVKEFERITGFSWQKETEGLLKPKLPPMTPKQNCEQRYRHLFFNVLVRLVMNRETGKECSD